MRPFLLALAFLLVLAAAFGCDSNSGNYVPPDRTVVVQLNPQGNVAWVTTGNKNYTIDVSAHPTAQILWQSVNVVAPGDLNQASYPRGWVFPDELLTFTIFDLASAGGESLTATLTYPTAYPAGALYFKATAAGFAPYTPAVINGNTVTLPLTDGGAGDMDSVNGQITDPGGPALCRTSAWAVGDHDSGYASILHTENGGATWTRQGSPAQVPDTCLYDVAAIDPRTAWAVGDSSGGFPTILRTDDGGVTWQTQGTTDGLPDQGLLKVSAPDGQTAWAVGAGGFIVHTDDGGASWHQQGLGQVPDVHYQGVFALDTQRVWVTGEKDSGFGTLLRSCDGGATWERLGNAQTVPNTYFLDVHMLPSGTGWAVGHGPNILKTTDFGQTWAISHGSMAPDLWLWDANGVWATNEAVCWVSQDYGQLWRTADGGGHWHVNRGATACYMMGIEAMDANIAWAVGNYPEPDKQELGSIARTLDAGVTWTQQAFPVQTGLLNISLLH